MSDFQAGPQAGRPSAQADSKQVQGLAPSAAGVRFAGPAPDFRVEAMARRGIVPIAFDPRQQVPGLDGCTGIARLGICVLCDRLYQSGKQIPVAAVRGLNGTYECGNQVVDGVHVTTVNPATEGQHP